MSALHGRQKSKTNAPATSADSSSSGTLFGLPISDPLRHFIGNYPFPPRLNEFHLRRFEASKKAKLFEKGTILFEQGTIPSGAFVILEGRVKKFLTSVEGRARVIGLFGPGSIIGLAANILGSPHTVTAETVERTRLVFVPRRELLTEMRSDAMAAIQIAQLMSENYNFLMGKMASVELSESAPQTVARCLLGFTAENASSDRNSVNHHPSQETIADMVGLSRETVCRQLAKLRREGVVDWSRFEFVIRNRRVLEQIAASGLDAA